MIRTPDGRVLVRDDGLDRRQDVSSRCARWQLRQTSANTLDLARGPVAHPWRPEVAAEIAAQLTEKFGRGLQYEVVPVDDIPLAPTGKFQTIVPLPEGRADAYFRPAL